MNCTKYPFTFYMHSLVPPFLRLCIVNKVMIYIQQRNGAYLQKKNKVIIVPVFHFLLIHFAMIKAEKCTPF